MDDELFGHERGAFTGAVASRRGRFEAADGGTLFLDEIGELPMPIQAKLLRILQERTLERLGSNTSLSVDIRLICATHCDLPKMIEQGTFREDLYYRLNVVELNVPPLRERRESISKLAQHFLVRFATQFEKDVSRFAAVALTALENHSWPGNVRELENVIQRAVVLADSPAIDVWQLPAEVRKNFVQSRLDPCLDGGDLLQSQLACSFDGEVREFKRRLLVRTLNECSGNKAQAARVLGVARPYLHRLLHQFQIRKVDVGFGAGVGAVSA